MSFNLMGLKPISDEGLYFDRTNLWWTALWEGIIAVCSDIITEEEMSLGSSHDCLKFGRKRALIIAQRLQKKTRGERHIYRAVRYLLRHYNGPETRDELYQMVKEDFQVFAEFAKNSGGFEIC